jgi:hypothetical protein
MFVSILVFETIVNFTKINGNFKNLQEGKFLHCNGLVHLLTAVIPPYYCTITPWQRRVNKLVG